MAVELRACQGVPVQVVEDNELVVVEEPLGEPRADEARAARDEEPLRG
jgi:hypothetical protein